MKYIELQERKDVLQLGFKDKKGNIVKDSKGNEVYIEFDLGDINLPLNYNRCVNDIEKARRNLKAQFVIIDKKQDHKGKQLLSSNEYLKAKAIKQFYKDMEIAMDLFLGQGGTKKFLNGKNPYWEMWDDIDKMLKPYYGDMKLTVDSMSDRIKEKYKIQESDVLTNDE